MGFMTDAVHAGQHPEETSGAVITPIFQTATYAQAAPGEHTGYEYGRTGNPTRAALEKNLAALVHHRCCRHQRHQRSVSVSG